MINSSDNRIVKNRLAHTSYLIETKNTPKKISILV